MNRDIILLVANKISLFVPRKFVNQLTVKVCFYVPGCWWQALWHSKELDTVVTLTLLLSSLTEENRHRDVQGGSHSCTSRSTHKHKFVFSIKVYWNMNYLRGLHRGCYRFMNMFYLGDSQMMKLQPKTLNSRKYLRDQIDLIRWPVKWLLPFNQHAKGNRQNIWTDPNSFTIDAYSLNSLNFFYIQGKL